MSGVDNYMDRERPVEEGEMGDTKKPTAQDIESALNAWADELREKAEKERDEARRERDRLARILAARGEVADGQ